MGGCIPGHYYSLQLSAGSYKEAPSDRLELSSHFTSDNPTSTVRMLWTVLVPGLLGQALCVSFTNHWSTLVPGGLEKAKQVAEDTGRELLYEIIPGDEKKTRRLPLERVQIK